ncbi:hypothetical protein GJW-30_1_01561 [Variibacter gotjawalensis]|uniref:GlcG protein n=1 Tax=Variibacter gotjawalensis TaxID=1333996 RepID=A0A0S3PSY5_9BRAD|nr:heme-binding protein [Variibacter gotjawalensis]NIK49346.1 uncharacterized protein GlcG (DUF336 family) [Variibacter gotjawalensis]RZS51197.1 uncharacterized protein GlcG (DUF336 family) [Variibacter gotjawalensis]BAT59032.1 hypothetical protein GJW-30_1_01561 [Variibacter gotjawalensis]
MSRLTLDHASTIVDAALKIARELKLGPMTVAVLDAGGHLVAFKREDKSSLLRYEIATGKAYGALGMGISSRTLEQRGIERPHFINALMAASNGRVVPVAGGVLIKDSAGDTIGAVGISGDTSDNDEACCFAGVEAAGLKSA